MSFPPRRLRKQKSNQHYSPMPWVMYLPFFSKQLNCGFISSVERNYQAKRCQTAFRFNKKIIPIIHKRWRSVLWGCANNSEYITLFSIVLKTDYSKQNRIVFLSSKPSLHFCSCCPVYAFSLLFWNAWNRKFRYSILKPSWLLFQLIPVHVHINDKTIIYTAIRPIEQRGNPLVTGRFPSQRTTKLKICYCFRW